MRFFALFKFQSENVICFAAKTSTRSQITNAEVFFPALADSSKSHGTFPGTRRERSGVTGDRVLSRSSPAVEREDKILKQ